MNTTFPEKRDTLYTILCLRNQPVVFPPKKLSKIKIQVISISLIYVQLICNTQTSYLENLKTLSGVTCIVTIRTPLIQYIIRKTDLLVVQQLVTFIINYRNLSAMPISDIRKFDLQNINFRH